MKSKRAETSIYACGLLRRGDGQFLLGRRSRKKRFYPGVWDLPGGHVRAAESAEDALARELDEEIGIIPTSFHLVEVLEELNVKKNGPGVYHIFLVKAWEGGEPSIRNQEHTDLRWCTLKIARKLELADDRYLELFRRLES